MLTDRAQETANSLGMWMVAGAWCLVAYAASRHVAWQDAVAGTFVVAQLVRAVAQRQRPDGGGK